MKVHYECSSAPYADGQTDFWALCGADGEITITTLETKVTCMRCIKSLAKKPKRKTP